MLPAALFWGLYSHLRYILLAEVERAGSFFLLGFSAWLGCLSA